MRSLLSTDGVVDFIHLLRSLLSTDGVVDFINYWEAYLVQVEL